MASEESFSRPLSALEAVRSRRSVRAFTAEPVPRAVVEEILAAASRAPSGSNIQPWKVHAVAGTAREALSAELRAAHFDPADTQAGAEYTYYPTQWFEPYLGRRRKIGWDLYGLLGIAKGDRAAMAEQHARNYDFFGAPVGLFFTMDRRMEQGSWLDVGMFMENVMVAARGLGLDTCPQAAFITHHRIVRRHLDIPDTDILLSGMALGHADPDAPENRLETERAPVSAFTRFHGI